MPCVKKLHSMPSVKIVPVPTIDLVNIVINYLMHINNNNNNIHLYGAISNLKLLFGATNKNVNKHDQLGTLR